MKPNRLSSAAAAAFAAALTVVPAAARPAGPIDQVSAIEAMARKIQRLHKLTDYDLSATRMSG